jgi:predicted alpha/beta hydrolase family esterase
MTELHDAPSPGRRFLLVHGVQHRRPREHWMWWLTESLRRSGEQVLYPQFPAPEQPSVDEWTDLLHAELAQLGDGERVVVCHSLGCALWLRAAQKLPAELRVSRVLLVSPLGAQAFTAANANEEFAPGSVDPELLAAASTMPPRVVASSTDPYAPTDPRAWSATLGMACDLLPDAGHITPGDGYGPWPAVLDWCLRDRVPVTGARADRDQGAMARPVGVVPNAALFRGE